MKGFGELVLVAFYSALLLASCSRHQPGPKLIEADGSTYMACGGATWLLDDGNPKDSNTWSYDVIYRDAGGKNHELKRVRMLRVTDLAADSPQCRTTVNSK